MATVDFLKEVSDPYNRRARVFPGITITLPITVLAVVLVTTRPAWWSAAVLLLGASGASYFGAQVVRSAGRRGEGALWVRWGGAPTNRLLRFREASNRVSVKRRHDQLARLFPDLHIPNEAAEAADPQLADEKYEVAVRALIELTRDEDRFARVFDELCQYGFRRNLWGCRGLAVRLAVIGLLGAISLGGLDATGLLNVSVLGLTLAASVDVLLLIAYRFMVRPEWVHEAAEAYAHRLLGTLEILA